MTEKEFLEAVELYIDANGLDNAVGALVYVAHEKADHVRLTWQDNMLAAQWDRAARILDKAESELVERGLTFR